MSRQSVLMRYAKRRPDCDISVIEVALDEDERRFERAARATWNKEWPLSHVFFCTKENPSYTRNELYEKNKQNHIDRYLEFLIDLYDYKTIVPLVNKDNA